MRTAGVLLGLCLALAACDAGGSRTSAPQDTGPPNILIIVTDDQRADGTMQVMPKTLRWFGDEGTAFSNAFVSTPQCCPSRASIFTGRYAHNHGVLSNTEGWARKLDQATTVQSQIDGTHRRWLFGKYLNGWGIQRAPADFDRWSFFDREDVSENGYYGVPFNSIGNVHSVPHYSTSYIAHKATIAIKDAAQDDAFFMVVAFWAPHAPAIPAKRYADAEVPAYEPPPAAEDDLSDEPAFLSRLQTPSTWTQKLAKRQLRTLMSVDDAVDQIMSSIPPIERDNTLAFYTSDNGFLWGEYGVTDKTVPYTGSIKVPLLLRWPGHVEAGRVDDRLVSNVDIAASIYDALNKEPPVALDGHSLLAGAERDEVLAEYWQKPGHPTLTWASLRGSNFQYVEYFATPESDRVVDRAYYDLSNDPDELINLLGDDDPSNDPNLAALHRRLTSARSCLGEECP